MLKSEFSQRSFLKLTAATGATFLLASCFSKDPQKLTFLDRVLGRPRTDFPRIEGAWKMENANSKLVLDLSKLPEFDDLGSAVRIEGEALETSVLVVYGDDGKYYAFKNACTHAGRRIDPLQGTMTMECCSVSSSTFNYKGEVLSGPADEALTSFPLSLENDYLSIQLN